MIVSSWPRLVIGTILLLAGAAVGAMAWATETCSGGAADSLWGGAVALIANVAAWALLGRRVPSKPVLFVAALPALAALSYSWSTLQLAVGYLFRGRGACALLKADETFPADGREPLFIFLWLLVCLSFWAGLIPVLMRALRVHGGFSERE